MILVRAETVGVLARRAGGRRLLSLLSTPTSVARWRLMQPVVNLEEQSQLEAAVLGSDVETRARSAQILVDKKQQSILCE